ncbi:hypothetical protein GCM10022393_29830 [Aquimarina addita]|uniref:MORN repeat protein n=1 Tax=Aquimarina addita TaxID=870485 RepID=A0ABP6UQV7_9FLAO
MIYYKYIIHSTLIKHHIYSISIIFCVLTTFYSCNNVNNETSTIKENINIKTPSEQKFDYSIDISKIPKDTITASDHDFSIKNGLFYFKNQQFSGILKKYHPRVKMTAYISVHKGKRHGAYHSFYDNGNIFETKQYKYNRVTGKHNIYWKSGILKSDYWYHDGKMEGTQKKWYADGSPFSVFNYKNGKREGIQKAWRASGKLHINNEIKNGKTYGLNRASLCYNVKKQKPVIIGYTKKQTENRN